MNGDSENDDSDRDHAQEGQEPVGQSMKSLVTRGRQKEKKCGSKPYGPTVHWLTLSQHVSNFNTMKKKIKDY